MTSNNILKIISIIYLASLFLKFIKFYHILLPLLNCSIAFKKNASRAFQSTKPTLYVVSHDYQFLDILAILNMLEYSNQKHAIVFANYWWNKLIAYFMDSSKLKPIYVEDGTTKKMINNLKNNRNVIIFLYRNINSSGIYWVAKELNCNIVLIKIKSNKKIISTNKDKINLSYALDRTINHQLSVDYQDFIYDKYLMTNKEKFMRELENELYI